MSKIASGPGVTGPIVETGAVRAVGSADAGAAQSVAAPPSGGNASAAPVVTTTALDPGSVPVDQDRVATIRQAIATDSYPVVPTKIGDAMIAAGLLLRMSK